MSPELLTGKVFSDRYLAELLEQASGDDTYFELLFTETVHAVRAFINPQNESIQQDWYESRQDLEAYQVLRRGEAEKLFDTVWTDTE